MMIRMAITMIIIRFDRSLAPCMEALKQQAQTYRGLPNSSKSKKWSDKKKGNDKENLANIYQSVINNINKGHFDVSQYKHQINIFPLAMICLHVSQLITQAITKSQGHIKYVRGTLNSLWLDPVKHWSLSLHMIFA